MSSYSGTTEYGAQDRGSSMLKFAGKLVLLNTLFWIAYIVFAQLGMEEQFPLGKQIMRLEGRERVTFLEPDTGAGAPEGTLVYSPENSTGLVLPEEQHSWAFSVDTTGSYAIGVKAAGTALFINPRVLLYDRDGVLITDNSRSSYWWRPTNTSRFHGTDGRDEFHEGLGIDSREQANSHGSGITVELEAGKTYIAQVQPENNQDFTHKVVTGSGERLDPNRYSLILLPFRNPGAEGSVSMGMLIFIPIIYLYVLIRYKVKQHRRSRNSRVGNKLDKRNSDFQQRVEEKRREMKRQ